MPLRQPSNLAPDQGRPRSEQRDGPRKDQCTIQLRSQRCQIVPGHLASVYLGQSALARGSCRETRRTAASTRGSVRSLDTVCRHDRRIPIRPRLASDTHDDAGSFPPVSSLPHSHHLCWAENTILIDQGPPARSASSSTELPDTSELDWRDDPAWAKLISGCAHGKRVKQQKFPKRNLLQSHREVATDGATEQRFLIRAGHPSRHRVYQSMRQSIRICPGRSRLKSHRAANDSQRHSLASRVPVTILVGTALNSQAVSEVLPLCGSAPFCEATDWHASDANPDAGETNLTTGFPSLSRSDSASAITANQNQCLPFGNQCCI